MKTTIKQSHEFYSILADLKRTTFGTISTKRVIHPLRTVLHGTSTNQRIKNFNSSHSSEGIERERGTLGHLSASSASSAGVIGLVKGRHERRVFLEVL